MVLAPHATLGAAVALQFPDKPILGFSLAFLSHFFLDAIPHWDYLISLLSSATKEGAGFLPKSVSDFLKNKDLVNDVVFVGVDLLIGAFAVLFAVLLAAPRYWIIAFMGALGGILPDFLQLVYWISPKSPLVYYKKFHSKIHAKKRLGKSFLNVGQQIVLIVLLTAIIVYSLK